MDITEDSNSSSSTTSNISNTKVPTTENDWKKVCDERWPGTFEIMSSDGLFLSKFLHGISYKDFYSYMDNIEYTWYKKSGSSKIKVIQKPNPKTVEKRKEYAFEPIGISKKFAVAIRAVKKKSNGKEECDTDEDESYIGKLFYLCTCSPKIVVKDDDDNPARWRPFWEMEKSITIKGFKMGRLCSDDRLIIITKTAEDTSPISTLYKVKLSGITKIHENKIPMIPKSIACFDSTCFYSYDVDDMNIRGIHALHYNLVGIKYHIRLSTHKSYSLNIIKDCLGDNMLCCGMIDENNNSKTQIFNLGDMNDLSQTKISPMMLDLWPDDINEDIDINEFSEHDKLPQKVKFFLDKECGGYQLVQTSKKHITMIRKTTIKKEHEKNNCVKNIGSILDFDVCGNTVVCHHLSNDIMIYHHTSGHPPMKNITLKPLGKSHRIKSEKYYDSIVMFTERIAILLPDTTVVFICLNEQK